MRLWRTTKDEKELGPRRQCPVAPGEKSAYTPSRTGPGHSGRIPKSCCETEQQTARGYLQAPPNVALVPDTRRGISSFVVSHLCWLMGISLPDKGTTIASLV